MKQIVVLEEHEVKLLAKGKTLLLTTQSGEQLGVQFAANGNSYNDTAHDKLHGKPLQCPICKVTETVSWPNKPFTKMTLARHISKAHGKGALKEARRENQNL